MNKITFVQVNYSGNIGKSIMVFRGSLMREYPYSYKNVGTLIRVAELRGYTLYSDHGKMTLDAGY